MVRHILKFGMEVHVLQKWKSLSKFEAKTTPGFIVGYTNRSNTYKIYVPEIKRVIVSCDVMIAPHGQKNVNQTFPGRTNSAPVENRVRIDISQTHHNRLGQQRETNPFYEPVDNHILPSAPTDTETEELMTRVNQIAEAEHRIITIEELSRQRGLLDSFFQQFIDTAPEDCQLCASGRGDTWHGN